MAMFVHGSHLYAIPDANPTTAGASYKLHKLDLGTMAWEVVATAGQLPCVRSEAASVFSGGGRAAAGPLLRSCQHRRSAAQQLRRGPVCRVAKGGACRGRGCMQGKGGACRERGCMQGKGG